MTQSKRPGVAQWKIRRAGIRGVRVCERHGDRDAAIAAFTTTLPPRVENHLGLHGTVQALETDARRRQAHAQALTAVLHTRRVRWLGLLVRDIPELSAREFTARRQVPDEVIQSAELQQKQRELTDSALAVHRELVPLPREQSSQVASPARKSCS